MDETYKVFSLDKKRWLEVKFRDDIIFCRSNTDDVFFDNYTLTVTQYYLKTIAEKLERLERESNLLRDRVDLMMEKE